MKVLTGKVDAESMPGALRNWKGGFDTEALGRELVKII